MGMGGPRQGLTGRGGAGKGGGITSLMPQQHAQSPMQQVNSPALPAGYDPNVHVPSIGFMPGMQPAQPSMGQPSMGQPGQPGEMQSAQHAAAEARYQAQQPMMPPSNPGEMRSFGIIPGAMQPAQPMGQMTPYTGMRTGMETPEQLAMMGANQSRSPQERAQAMQGDAFRDQQMSMDALNQARQMGFGQPAQQMQQSPFGSQMRMQQMQQSPFGSQMRLPPQMQQSPFGSQMRLPPQMMNPQRYGGGKGGGGGLHGLSARFAQQRFRR